MCLCKEHVEDDYTQLDDVHYKHTIWVSQSVLSNAEYVTLTALSLPLYFGCFRDDIIEAGNLKVAGLSLFLLILAGFLGRIFWGVKIESIFIVKGLGLQTTTVYHSSFKSSKFIPWNSIKDVVINEGIVMQKVIYYLAVLVRAGNNHRGESIIPIFTHARPRLRELKKIYRSVQLILRD